MVRGLAAPRRPPRNAAGIPVLRDPKHQLVEPQPRVRRLLRDQGGGRHAGLSVDLQQDQIVVNAVITKVASGNPIAPKCVVRRLGVIEGYGSGYDRIVAACRDGGYPEPDWIVPDESH